jgi:hypothetical protein
MSWTAGSKRQMFLICDAPGHGKDIYTGWDDYPNGSPDGFRIQYQMKKIAEMGINFCIIRVNALCDKMIGVMKENYNSDKLELSVTDLEKALQTKSAMEVTKEFVAATSHILSKTIGGSGKTGKGGKGPVRKNAVKLEPLWDTKKFEEGQYLSQLAYYTVTAIEAGSIEVKTQHGDLLDVSKDILEKMHSASHYKHEFPMTMTELAEKLEGAGDTVFTVNFRKKVD